MVLKQVTELRCNHIFNFEGVSHEEWEYQRNNNYGLDIATIGGSDAGVIMGVNKYKDLPQLYLEKKKLVDIPVDNEAVEWGHRHENTIAQAFAEKFLMFNVINYNYLLQNPDYPFQVANIDRLLYDIETGEYGLLEIKTASEYVKGDWDNGNIPPSYYAQIQHYFSVTGLQWGYFAVLIGGNKFRTVEVQRNDEYINSLLFQEEMFVTRLELNQAPEITGSDSSSEVLKHLHPQATEEKEVLSFDDRYGQLLVKRQELKEAIKELESEAAECENKIKELLGDKKLGEYSDGFNTYKVSWGNVKGRVGFDAKTFEKEHPELYKQYIKEGNPSRQFRVTVKGV